MDRGNTSKRICSIYSYQINTTSEYKEKTIRVYASDLLLLNTNNNIRIEQINLSQAAQLQVLSALSNHLKSGVKFQTTYLPYFFTQKFKIFPPNFPL